MSQSGTLAGLSTRTVGRGRPTLQAGKHRREGGGGFDRKFMTEKWDPAGHFHSDVSVTHFSVVPRPALRPSKLCVENCGPGPHA